jgi:nitroreductase
MLYSLLELSLNAPTSSDTQAWSYIVVSGYQQKQRLARLYLPLVRILGPIGRRHAAGDDRELRRLAPAEWQAEHFAEIPVFVIACYDRNLQHRPVGWPQISVSSFYGSVFPAVQNLLLGCRAVGLGASLQTLPIWLVPAARRILGLPHRTVPVCVIPIGWARGHYGPTTRRPVRDVVHIDRYGNQPDRTLE